MADFELHSWTVNFSDGLVNYAFDNNGSSFVRCVLDGQDVTDGDLDGEIEPEFLAEYESETCNGGVCTDPVTGLEWQETPATQMMVWENAAEYCQNLVLNGTGWRLPNISELRSIVRNCTPIETSGDCGVKDVCSPCGIDAGNRCLAHTCWTEAECNPPSCDENGKPTGCYWMEQLKGTCSWYWSSSSLEDYPNYAWYTCFNESYVNYGLKAIKYNVRCLRS